MLGTARADSAWAIYSKVSGMVKDNAEAASVETLLGYVIVHELAHLIKRSDLHSTGIMSEGWTVQHLRSMAQRRLQFTASQTRDLRRGIEVRMGNLAVPAE